MYVTVIKRFQGFMDARLREALELRLATGLPLKK